MPKDLSLFHCYDKQSIRLVRVNRLPVRLVADPDEYSKVESFLGTSFSKCTLTNMHAVKIFIIVKKDDHAFVLTPNLQWLLSQILTDFSYFTAGNCMKFPIKIYYYFPS